MAYELLYTYIIQVGYDDSILAKLGSASAVEAYWNAAAPHLQARYCHSTLGTQIRVERIGNFKHYSGKTLTASGANLQMMFSDTANDVGDADLIVYMCHEEMVPGWQTVGIAYGGVNCDSSWYNKYKQSINEASGYNLMFQNITTEYIYIYMYLNVWSDL